MDYRKQHANSSLIQMSFINLMVVICLCKTHECGLSWTIEKKVSQYGDDLSLFCPVDKCCPESAGWVKWTSKDVYTTLFIDVKDLDVHESFKYNGETNKTGISLVIRNVTRDDLNTSYSCTYGFQVGTKKILLDSDAFIDKVKEQYSRESELPETTEKTEDESSQDRIRVTSTGYAIAMSLLAVLVVVVFIIAVVILVYFKNKDNTEMDPSEDVREDINIFLSMNVDPVQTRRNPLNDDHWNLETQLFDTDEKASPPRTFVNLQSSIDINGNAYGDCRRETLEKSQRPPMGFQQIELISYVYVIGTTGNHYIT